MVAERLVSDVGRCKRTCFARGGERAELVSLQRFRSQLISWHLYLLLPISQELSVVYIRVLVSCLVVVRGAWVLISAELCCFVTIYTA